MKKHNKKYSNKNITKPHLYFNTIRKRVRQFEKQTALTEMPKVGRPKKLEDGNLLAALIYACECGVNDNYLKAHKLLQRELSDKLNLPHYNNFLKQAKQIEGLKQAYLEFLSTKADSSTTIADSAPMPVCKYIRASRHKASEGKAAFGWSIVEGHYLGFKMHMSVNLKQQFLSFKVTPANVYDGHFAEDLKTPLTKIFIGDNHYSSAELRQSFKAQGIKVMALKRKDAKDKSQPADFKVQYKYRKRVETAFSTLKRSFNLVTSKARSYVGFISHYTTALLGYAYSRLYG